MNLVYLVSMPERILLFAVARVGGFNHEAAVIIWAGIVFIADYLNILPEIGGSNAWSWIFLGAGAFGLLGAFVRVASADLPKPTGWDYFWSALFLIIGASGFVGAGITFPIVLIVIGLAILGNVLFRRD